MTTPTPQGVLRYPDTDGYFISEELEGDQRIACTCTPFCQRPCTGHCDCDACGLRFAMWCDAHGYYNVEFTEEVEATARREFAKAYPGRA